MRYSILVLIAAAVFFFSFGIHAPGVVFEIETTYHSGAEPRVESSEMSVEGHLVKIGIASSEDKGAKKDDVIYNGERRQMVVVDHERKSYMVMDEESISAAAGEVGKAMKEMEDMLKNMPEDVRKQIEEAQKQGVSIPGMGQAKPNAPQSPFFNRTVKRSGERGTKQGYPCVKYDVFNENKEKVQELWVTDWGNIDGGGEARDAFADMSDFFQEMLEAMPQFGGEDNSPFEGSTPFDLFEEIDGFPIVTREFEDGDLESETVLRSSRRQTLDPDAFEPPPGYRLRTMFSPSND